MLPFADHITVLSADGRIVDHDPSQYQNADFGVTEATNPKSDDGNKDDTKLERDEQSTLISTADTSDAAIFDAARRTSDMSVYLYYARAAGLTATVCFLSVTMACTFCESFAGELQLQQECGR